MDKIAFAELGIREPASPASLVFDEANGIDRATLRQSFEAYGVVAIRPAADFGNAQQAFEAFYTPRKNDRQLDRFNPGVNFFADEQLPSEVLGIETSPLCLATVRDILAGDPHGKHSAVGIVGSKLIIKDGQFAGAVPLHQDSCYQLGRDKVTAFFLFDDLTAGPPRDGTVRALLGTHKFGHLADAGEIDRTILEDNWPELEFAFPRHTLILMDPHIWHYSNSSDLSNDRRAIYTFTYAEHSPVCERVPGRPEKRHRNAFTEGGVFRRSRVGRLKELQRQVDAKNASPG